MTIPTDLLSHVLLLFFLPLILGVVIGYAMAQLQKNSRDRREAQERHVRVWRQITKDFGRGE